MKSVRVTDWTADYSLISDNDIDHIMQYVSQSMSNGLVDVTPGKSSVVLEMNLKG